MSLDRATRSPANFGLKLGLLMAALIASSACAGPSFRERFPFLSTSERQAFLARYPDMNADQRQEAESGVPPLKPDEKLSATIRRLEINLDAEQQLHAKLIYQDGRTADATADTEFHVAPSVARIEDRRHLIIDCAHVDLVVNGDFFGEAAGRIVIQSRKAVRTLALRQDEAFAARGHQGNYRLAAAAVCADNTRADVTCLADWHTSSRAIELTGCGKIRVLDEAALRTAASAPIIEARYGGQTARWRLRTY